MGIMEQGWLEWLGKMMISGILMQVDWIIQHVLKEVDDSFVWSEIPNGKLIQVLDINPCFVINKQEQKGGGIHCEKLWHC